MPSSVGVVNSTMHLTFIDQIKLALQNCKVRLFHNDIVPDRNTLLSAFEEVVATGVTFQTLGDGATDTFTAATAADPVVLTKVGHGLVTGDLIDISGFTGGWAAVNGRHVVTRVDADDINVPVDGAAFGAMAGTGVARLATIEWGNRGTDSDGVAYVTTEMISFQQTGIAATDVAKGFYLENPGSDVRPVMSGRFSSDVALDAIGKAVNFFLKLRSDGKVICQLADAV